MTEQDFALEGAQVFSFKDGDCRRKTDVDEAFNGVFGRKPLVVKPGEFAFLDDDFSMMVATAGVGVVVTVYDEKLHFGVMAYVVLPDSVLDSFPDLSNICPHDLDRALSPLEGAIGQMKRNGAGKKRIRLRLFGGSDFAQDNDRGIKTSVFVKEYLSRHGLSIMGEDLGGQHVRRIHFSPDNEAATRFFLKRQSDYDAVIAEETLFMNT